MRLVFPIKIVLAVAISACSTLACAEFKLTSPSFEDGDFLPKDLTCTRDGGDGQSPPLSWTDAPAGTKSFALIEHHYPRGTIEGIDDPSYYWLLWDIPVEASSILRGNTESVGHHGGGSKLGGTAFYVPPCSPPESGVHTYVIEVFALNTETAGLADHDDLSVDWATMVNALKGKVIAKAALSFKSGHPREAQAVNN